MIGRNNDVLGGLVFCGQNTLQEIGWGNISVFLQFLASETLQLELWILVGMNDTLFDHCRTLMEALTRGNRVSERHGNLYAFCSQNAYFFARFGEF